MRLGMTYDLRQDYLALGWDEEETAELDGVETLDAIAGALGALGYDVDRIGNVHRLAERLVAGERWELVFNIAEGFAGVGREAQVPALLDAYEVPYVFSDPLVCALTLHKGMTKRLVRDMGVPTPAFAVVTALADAEAVELPFPLFVKPVAEGTSKGISAASRVTGRAELLAECRRQLPRFPAGLLVETYLPGRELTVGVLGSGARAEAVAAMEVTLLPGAEEGIYSWANKDQWEERCRYALAEGAAAEEARALALAVWRGLGCRDGGRVDLRADAAGRLAFLEVNPLPGLDPVKGDLPILCRLAGMPYQELLGRIVDSARARLTPRSPAAAATGGE
ncbi:MAG TPA: D-alanine--D-alanine ligase [Thermoanaerobaculia bacterium]|nr:D-alanine--D-alanine ligase [Thermoanaerobaculia bacterium]